MTPLPLHLPGCFLKSSLPQTYTKASLGLSTKASVASITGELLPPAGPTCLTGPPPTPIGLPLSSHLCKYKPAERESLGLKDVPDLLPKHEPPPHPADTAAHARKRSRRLSKNFVSSAQASEGGRRLSTPDHHCSTRLHQEEEGGSPSTSLSPWETTSITESQAFTWAAQPLLPHLYWDVHRRPFPCSL